MLVPDPRHHALSLKCLQPYAGSRGGRSSWSGTQRPAGRSSDLVLGAERPLFLEEAVLSWSPPVPPATPAPRGVWTPGQDPVFPRCSWVTASGLLVQEPVGGGHLSPSKASDTFLVVRGHLTPSNGWKKMEEWE